MEKIRSNDHYDHHDDHTDIDDQIPIFHFPKELQGCDDQYYKEYWETLSGKMREACESYGCFLLNYEEIVTMKLREEMFMATKALFDLPEETKQKHSSSKPYRSYVGNCPVIPLSESFGIDNGSSPESIQAFTHLMWPQGNDHFCESVFSMGEKMVELCLTILRMVLESLGMEKHYASHVEGMSSVMRLMKYRVGDGGDAAQLGLVAHTDKSALTVICQNDVQGLELLTKQGNWIQMNLPESSFAVFVGDALKAWSNGRLHAATHRVMLKGGKERYSCGVFLVPKEEVTIEVPQELVDKDHPLLYRPFKFSDYFSYYVSNISDDALEVYAGFAAATSPSRPPPIFIKNLMHDQ